MALLGLKMKSQGEIKTVDLVSVLSAARRAFIHSALVILGFPLQDRFLLQFVAVWTYPMRWSGFVYLALIRVHEKTRNHFLKMILCGSGVPFLHLHQLIFEILFLLQNERIVIAERKYQSLQGNDMAH